MLCLWVQTKMLIHSSTTRMLFQGLFLSGQSSVIDTKADQTKLICYQVKVIATNILRSSSRVTWQLQNINFSNDNASIPVYVYFFHYHQYHFYRTWLRVTRRNCLIPFTTSWVHTRDFSRILVSHLSIFLCCIFWFVCLSSVTCALCCLSLWIVH